MPGMDGFINFNGTLEGSIAGGGGGDVTDVKVRDSQETTFESVVNEEGVAEIDLISYVRRNELSQELITLENDINTELERKQNIYDYSTDEQPTGQKWIDGKNIYQKTFALSNQLTINTSSWTNTNLIISNVETFINGYGIASDGTFQGSVAVDKNNDIIYLQSTRSPSSYIKYLTIQYTKNTD